MDFPLSAPAKLDLKDRKILFEISLNPRVLHSEIAKRVGLPRETVSYRIKALTTKNVLLGAYAMVNPKLFHHRKYTILLKLKSSSNQQREEMVRQLRSIPSILSLAECGGKWDAIITLVSPSLDELAAHLAIMRRKLRSHLSDFTIVPILCERYLFYGFFGDETPS